LRLSTASTRHATIMKAALDAAFPFIFCRHSSFSAFETATHESRPLHFAHLAPRLNCCAWMAVKLRKHWPLLTFLT
jgi:hypothetical protein